MTPITSLQYTFFIKYNEKFNYKKFNNKIQTKHDNIFEIIYTQNIFCTEKITLSITIIKYEVCMYMQVTEIC